MIVEEVNCTIRYKYVKKAVFQMPPNGIIGSFKKMLEGEIQHFVAKLLASLKQKF